MAAPVGELPQVGLLCTFGVGAFVMRGAGCTINDLWDRKIDAKVERTKTRPLASGVSRLYAHRSKSATLQSSRFVQALSVAQAVGFLGVQLSVGLAVLLSLNKSVALALSRSRVSRFCYQQLQPQCSCAAQQAHVRLQCSFRIRSYSIWLGVAAMPLVICYPLAKVRNHSLAELNLLLSRLYFHAALPLELTAVHSSRAGLSAYGRRDACARDST
jgi:4-hydroxybenzoate polyprenyltransferase